MAAAAVAATFAIGRRGGGSSGGGDVCYRSPKGLSCQKPKLELFVWGNDGIRTGGIGGPGAKAPTPRF